MRELTDVMRDWVRLKKMCNTLAKVNESRRKELLPDFYKGIKEYYEKYHIRFNYMTPPDENPKM